MIELPLVNLQVKPTTPYSSHTNPVAASSNIVKGNDDSLLCDPVAEMLLGSHGDVPRRHHMTR